MKTLSGSARAKWAQDTTRRRLTPLIASCLVGTTVEGFDFLLYALLSSLVFNKLFFPRLDPAVGTIAAFGVFAVGLAARPLGALVFGHFGDRIGRKPTTIYSLGLMGVTTGLMGFVPTHDSIGILAPIVLTVLRFLQGFAYGGENTAAPILVLESVPKESRGFYSAVVISGTLAGIVLAAFAVDIIARLPNDQLLSWGWRVPFILSVFVVALGLYIRLKIEESPIFLESVARLKPIRVPLAAVTRGHKKSTVIALVIAIGQASVYYFSSVYGLSYANTNLHLPRSTLLDGILIGNLIGVLSIPLYGMLSDRIGRRPVMAAAYVISALYFAFGFFPLLRTGNSIAVLLAMSVPGAILQSMTLAVGASFFGELYSDARIRFSGVALGKQVGSALGGGAVPVIAASLSFVSHGDQTSVIILSVGICLASFAATLLSRETRDVEL
ncbi:MAG TPA: MFS transporter [Candidatus Binataceae bacterium]|nr:MFS transporter [Candidatus Binataceae bacterium]